MTPATPDAPAALAPVTPPTPLSLLQAMIDKGVDPSALEKMMDLSERWHDGQARVAFNAAMTAAQAAMPAVVKDAVNSHTKSRYARLEAVQTAIRPVYTKHGFALSFGTLAPRLEGTLHLYCDVRHLGGHVERYEADIPLDGKGMQGGSNMTPLQGTGSSFSYGRRYLTLLVFNVTVADEDVDGIGSGVTPKMTQELNDAFAAGETAGVKWNHKALKHWIGVEDYATLSQRNFGVLLDHVARETETALKQKEKKK